jgi:hypothetical protein
MSKKRAGHQAAADLILSDNVHTWECVETNWTLVIDSIPDLRIYEESLQSVAKSISAAAASSKDSISKTELNQIVGWKHRVGKNRAFNVKHILANTDAAVESHSRAAINLIRNAKSSNLLDANGGLNAHGQSVVQQALAELGHLKGVGPATASAILTLVRPDIFCYMYDEVIDCFETKRDYKATQYVKINSRCLQLAHALGPTWTTSRVAKAIYTAARVLAIHGTQVIEPKEASEAGKLAVPGVPATAVKCKAEEHNTVADVALGKRLTRRNGANDSAPSATGSSASKNNRKRKSCG